MPIRQIKNLAKVSRYTVYVFFVYLDAPGRLGLLNLLGLRERPLILLGLRDRELLLPRRGLLLTGLLDFDLLRGLRLLPRLPDLERLRGLDRL